MTKKVIERLILKLEKRYTQLFEIMERCPEDLSRDKRAIALLDALADALEKFNKIV